MGQGASSPNGYDRTNNRRASMMDGRGDDDDIDMAYEDSDDGQSRTADATTTLRRSRRLRNHLAHLAQLGSRLVPNSTTDDDAERVSSRTLPRIRNRIRFLERSSPPRTLRSSPQIPNRPSILSNNASRERPTPSNSDDGGTQQRRTRVLMQDGDMDRSQAGRTDDSEQNAASEMAASLPFRARLSRVRSSLSTTLPNLPNLMDMGSRPTSRVFGGSSAERSRRSSYMDSLALLEEERDRERNAAVRDSRASSQPSEGTHQPQDAHLSGIPGGDIMDNPTRTRPGEDQATMLSRLLSVAAAMTAASLVGSNEQALSEARDVGGDNAEGGFDAFLRALQNGRLAAALRNGGNEMGGGITSDNPQEGNNVPLNFFRMFRFGASPPATQEDGSEGGPSTRMVPVIIVGIRSVPPRDGSGGEEGPAPPIWDALANLPLNIGSSNAQRRNRFSSTRRRGSTGTSAIDSNRTLFRNGPQLNGPQQTSSLSPEASLGTNTADSRASVASNISNTNTGESSQPAPRPTATASTPLSTAPQPDSTQSTQQEGQNEHGEEPGNTRRTNTEGTRSWIIYVLGGSYPENHPILTTPSLFTDAPTYEDMMMLSSLIGPAKPPVASQEDVESAGGLFIIGDTNSATTRTLQGERCLVCLSDYEMGEQCRELTKCHHIFHRGCIDEWLTTGRNSCPLCRAQGVLDTKKTEAAPTAPSGSSATNSSTAAAS